MSRDAVFDLSPSQELIWLHERLYPGSRTYSFVAILTLRGELDEPALYSGMTQVLDRHPGLRLELTGNRDERPAQRVAPECRPRYRRVDVSAEPDSDDAFDKILHEEAAQDFDTYQAPLMRWCLVRIADREHRLIHCEHHLIHDGRSFLVTMRDLFMTYRAQVTHEPLELPRPGSYLDYLDLSLSERDSPARRKGLEFWRKELTGATFETPLPGMVRSEPERRNHGAQLHQAIEPSLAHRLRARSEAGGHTVFTMMLGLFAELIRRHSGHRDLVIGTAVANRPGGFENVVGMFINVIPLRLRLDPDAPVEAVLDEVTETLIRVLPYQDVPIQQITNVLGLHTRGADNPVFNVAFNAADDAMPDVDVPGLDVRMFEGFNVGATRNDLDLVLHSDSRRQVSPRSGSAGMLITWDYDTDRFTEHSLRLLADRFETLLRAYADAAPTALFASLAAAPHLRSTTSRARMPRADLMDGTTAVPCATEGRDAGSLAIVSGAIRWTFGDLAQQVDRVAAALRGSGVVPGQPLAVVLPRSVDSSVMLLACLRIHAVYCPLSPKDPPGRLEALLQQLSPALVVTTGERRRRLPAAMAPVAALEERDWPPARDVPSIDAAYIVHTSGSTGAPKPVVVSREALSRQTAAVIDVYGLEPSDRVLTFAQPDFDVMFEEVLPTLAAGASLVVPQRELLTGRELVAIAAARGVTVANLPTSYVITIQDDLIAALRDGRWSPRLIVFGGERLPSDKIGGLLGAAEIAGATVLNAYGVTEATITSTVHEVTREDLALHTGIPLGTDLPGVRTTIVDSGLWPLPSGAVGEIAIGGSTLSNGYLGDEQATTARFFQAEPLGGERVYLTGDRGYRDTAGRLHFLGRIDDQIKLRGYRIDPGEIRWHLLAHPQVHDAYVTTDSQHGKEEVGLTAYVETGQQPEPELDIQDLRAHLVSRVPGHLIPTAFVFVAHLPRTPAGKIDRAALPRPVAPTPSAAEVAPASKLERRIAEIWAEVLGLDRVGRTDNFFDLGGHSLLLLLVHARITNELRADIPVTAMFRYPTIEALARLLADGMEENARESGLGRARLTGRDRLSRARQRREDGAPTSGGQER